jgi:NAD(P) transhydrogenase subunit beta
VSSTWIDLFYLVVIVLFIFVLKGLTHPRTAVRGNQLGALAMFLAVVITLAGSEQFSWTFIVIGIAIGAGGGAYLAKTVEMTDMPQLVALFNGFGGLASVFVAGAYLMIVSGESPESSVLVATAASGLIGAVTFTGSMVAFGKLQGLDFIKDVRFDWQQLLNIGLLVFALLFGLLLVTHSSYANAYYWLMTIISLVLGYFLVISIGGADMPVVIALLNSFSGLAAAATGFVLANNLLIVAGSLVGASGLILTQIMCVAMNRSLVNVLFGKLQPAAGEGKAADEVYANVKSTSPEEVAMMLEVASRVVIVPGYGMAVAQAQHAVSDLCDFLTEHDVRIEFGIHPVAGRMPGHMNVLLAEADIPYDLLKEMDEINPTFEQTDVAIVLGANDVVNPDAINDPNSPIAGMPIMEVYKARTVVIVKRSLSPGFAGIPNPLFAADNALMLFSDGREAMVDILKALREG